MFIPQSICSDKLLSSSSVIYEHNEQKKQIMTTTETGVASELQRSSQ